MCLFGGVAVGVSGFSSDSNHPTYLPPALHALDPAYLANDWWLQSASHYHVAFFVIVRALARLGVLETGLAVLNILTVAGALYACFRIVCDLTSRRRVTAFAIFVAIFLMTRSFYSLGVSYLFTPSLQPSSLAAAATLAAILSLLKRRPAQSGAWLALAGLFHVNFLVVNIPFFGLAYLLTIAQECFHGRIALRQHLVAATLLLGPSLLLLACFAPLLLGVEGEALSPSQTAAADWIFFKFAVPFHYYPLSYLDKLYPFFCWQMVGLLWTGHAVEDPGRRRVAWATQIALALIVWSATALTTIVFVPTISRLFLWRLAPFAVAFAALMVVVGTLRAASGEGGAGRSRKDWLVLATSVMLLPGLLEPAIGLAGQIVPTDGIWPAGAVLGTLFLVTGMCWIRRMPSAGSCWPTGAALCALLLAAVLTQPSDGKRSRYSLLFPTPDIVAEQELFAFVRAFTPRDARFVIPPDLDYFRLEGERATIVDFKAMPINKSGLIEWYRRLEVVSGTNVLANFYEVSAGYRTLDEARAERLRRDYGVTYIVLPSDRTLRANGWTRVFANHRFQVLAYRRSG